MAHTSRLLLLSMLVLTSAGCDQWTKYQAVASLTRDLDHIQGMGARIAHYLWHAHPTPSSAITVFDGWWRFTYAENPGAAFSFLANAWFGRWLLVVVSMATIVMFFSWALRQRGAVPFLGASLVIGGAIGNLFDRIRVGYVVDFVQWHYQDRWSWPVFNVADILIFIGGLLLFFSLVMRSRSGSYGPAA